MSLSLTFGLSTLACVALIYHGIDNQDKWYFPLMVLPVEYGISAAFTIVFVTHNQIFPILFTTTAMGVVNFASRIFAAFAPIIAKEQQPTPLLIIGSLSLASAIAVWRLEINKN